jgi:flagellar M-ring protein FliF
MNAFRDAIEQLRKMLAEMPMQGRLLAGLMGILVVVGIGLMVRTYSAQPDEYILGGRQLTDDELDRIEAAFGTAGLRDYERIGTRIRVPAAQRDVYLKVLAEADALPTATPNYLAKAIDAANPLESASQRQARIQNARERELAKQIEMFPQVEAAWVTYDEESQGFTGKVTKTAAVHVKPRGNESLSPYLRKQIQDLVAGSYAGLTAEQVVVSDSNSRGMDNAAYLGMDNKYYNAKRAYQEMYESDIRKLLAPVGEFQLTVGVELDPTLEREEAGLKYDSEPKTLTESSSRAVEERTQPNQGGVPGVASNAYGNKPVEVASGSDNMKREESTEDYTRVVGQIQTRSVQSALVPKRVSVSIQVPQSYYSKIFNSNWQVANPTATDPPPPMTTADLERIRNETTTSLKKLVATVLPPMPPGDDRFPQVEVQDYVDLPSPTVEPTSVANTALSYLAESWQYGLLALVALVALLVARSIGRGSPSSPTPNGFGETFGLQIPNVAAGAAGGEPGLGGGIGGEGPGGRRFTVTGETLRDELTSMIDQNPDAAANVLRGWIGDAA